MLAESPPPIGAEVNVCAVLYLNYVIVREGIAVKSTVIPAKAGIHAQV
jgi:hypothetical protein